MSQNNNVTSLDLNQMMKRTLDEKTDSQRVYIVGQDHSQSAEALAQAVKEGMSNLKLDIPKQEVIQVPVVVKETEVKVVEVPVIQTQFVDRVVEKPVIVKETEIKVIEVQKVVFDTKVEVIEKPVIVKETEIKEIKVSDSKAVIGLLILNAILLIAMIIK